jgi:hypothetical protein
MLYAAADLSLGKEIIVCRMHPCLIGPQCTEVPQLKGGGTVLSPSWLATAVRKPSAVQSKFVYVVEY